MFPNQVAKSGLLSAASGLKSINWASILDNTQKTLGVINQAIPIVYQVKPIINNAKTMFRIADVMKTNDNNSNSINSVSDSVSNNINVEQIKRTIFLWIIVLYFYFHIFL